MTKKESEFVKQIKKLEKKGYHIDGALLAFTLDGRSGTATRGNQGILLRLIEECKIQMDLLEAQRKAYVELETKKALGSTPSKSASYTD